MINKYLSVLLMMLALTIRPEHVAAQDFLLTIRVQTPAVDDGRPLGSLFDIVEANGNVVAAAGFESNTQSTAIGNTRAVQFYLGSNYSDETTYQVTSLPAPFLDSSGQPNNAAMFRMMSYQGQLIAYPYSPTLKVARVIGPGASSWRDFFHPALSSSTSPNLATDSVRFLQVVGNDLLAAYSKKLRYGKSIVDVQFPAPYSSGSQITLLSAGGYYGGRLYLVGQSNVANKEILFNCRWAPGQLTAICDKHVDLPNHGCASTPRTYKAYGVQPMQYDGRVFIYGLNGDLHHYDGVGSSNLLHQMRRSNCTSWQIYSAVSRKDYWYFGHYPSGNLYRLVGSFPSYSVNSISPASLAYDGGEFNGIYRASPEAQGLSLIGGQTWIGMWPWGEIFHGTPGQPYSKLTRFFSSPPLQSDVHPYQDDNSPASSNCLGQRIPQLLPWHNGFVASSWVKNNGKECLSYIDSHPIQNLSEYGRVKYYSRAHMTTCNIRWQGNMELEFRITNTLGTVRQLGTTPEITCSFPVNRPDLVARAVAGRKVLGYTNQYRTFGYSPYPMSIRIQ